MNNHFHVCPHCGRRIETSGDLAWSILQHAYKENCVKPTGLNKGLEHLDTNGFLRFIREENELY